VKTLPLEREKTKRGKGGKIYIAAREGGREGRGAPSLEAEQRFYTLLTVKGEIGKKADLL